MLPGMTEYQFATLFVSVNKDKIQKDLQIKYLNEEETVKTIAKFLAQKFNKKSDLINNKKFYIEIIKILHNVKNLEMTPEEYIDYLKKRLNKHTFTE